MTRDVRDIRCFLSDLSSIDRLSSHRIWSLSKACYLYLFCFHLNRYNDRLGLNMPGACSSSFRCRMVCITRSTTPSHHSLLIIYIHYIYFEIESCMAIFSPFFAAQINFRNEFLRKLLATRTTLHATRATASIS